MEERRKHQRTEINQPACVSAGGSVTSCTVRNISPGRRRYRRRKSGLRAFALSAW